MVQKVELKKIVFLIALLLVIICAGYFSFSTLTVRAVEDGSESSPFLIETKGDFLDHAMNGNLSSEGLYFKQTADIELTASDMGYAHTTLNGNYNGGGFKITVGVNSSLFKSIGENGKLSNLKVIGSNSATTVESVAGVTETLYGEIDSVSFDGTIRVNQQETSNLYVGAIAGQNIGGTIKNSYNLASIYKISEASNISSTYIGGLVGKMQGGNIYSSYNWGNIFFYAGKSTSYTGGIVGAVSGNSIIRNCYNSAEIESNSSYATLGGLVGLNSGSGEFSLINCYNIGDISGGALIGALIGSVQNTGYSFYNFNYYKNAENLFSCGKLGSVIGSDAVGDSKTEEEMADNSTYKGWLFGFDYSDFSGWVWSKNPAEIKINGEIRSRKLPRLKVETLEFLTPYMVSFDKNDDLATGTMTPQEMYAEKAYPIKAAAFSKKGFKVVGWSKTKGATLADKDYDAGASITVSSDLTLYAVWDYASTYTLTFDANGGTTPVTSKKVHTGIAIGELPTPTREGYDFLGWTITSMQTDAITASTIYTLNSSATATAQWQEIVYQVRYLDQPDNFTGVGYKLLLDFGSFSYTDEITHPLESELKIPARDGVIPVGISASPNGESGVVDFGTKCFVSDFVTDEGRIINLYVQWAKSDYILTLDAGAGSFASNSKTKKLNVTYRQPISNLKEEIPTYTGYVLDDKWELKKSDGTTIDIDETTKWMFLEDLTAEAKWTPIQYTVEFYKNYDEASPAVPVHTEECVFDSQSEYSFFEISRTGYSFLGYSQYSDGSEILEDSKPREDGGKGTYNNLMTTPGTLKLYAIWREHRFRINYHINNSNLIGQSDFYEIYNYTDKVTLKTNSNFPGAEENTRYVLNSFNTLAGGTGTKYPLGYDLSQQITGDGQILNLYAIWENMVLIKVEKHSSVTLSVGCNYYFKADGISSQLSSRYVIAGTKITITAEMSTGYGFLGWYSASGTKITSSTTSSYNPTSDITYYAKWEQTIIYCKCGDGNEAVTGNDYCQNCLNNWCSESTCGGCTLHNNYTNHKFYSVSSKVGSIGSASNVSATLKIDGTTYSSMPVSVHYGKSVSFVTSASTGTFLGWYSGTTTSTTHYSSSTTYSRSITSALTLYANWTYYECACGGSSIGSGCTNEVGGSYTLCYSCNQNDICDYSGCYNCSDHYNMCSNCGKCTDHITLCSNCGYDLCTNSGCCPGHGYECSCDGCSNTIYSGYQCSFCDMYTECNGCYNCSYSYHFNNICSTCGYCSDCGCKCKTCSCCNTSFYGTGNYCSSCKSSSTCSYGCGKRSCHCQCNKCLCCGNKSGTYDYCTINGCRSASKCQKSGCYRCSSCYTICSSCYKCTDLNHCTCTTCPCPDCGHVKFTGSATLCATCRGLGYTETCSSCGRCYGHGFQDGNVCYGCGRCPSCHPSTNTIYCRNSHSSSHYGYTACLGTTCEWCGGCYEHCSCECFCGRCNVTAKSQGSRLRGNSDASSGENWRPYCEDCIGTGWCYSCDSCGSCCTSQYSHHNAGSHRGNCCPYASAIMPLASSSIVPIDFDCINCSKDCSLEESCCDCINKEQEAILKEDDFEELEVILKEDEDY